jgi:hypothetical protein
LYKLVHISSAERDDRGLSGGSQGHLRRPSLSRRPPRAAAGLSVAREERGERVEEREIGKEEEEEGLENDMWVRPTWASPFFNFCVKLTCGSHEVYYFLY